MIFHGFFNTRCDYLNLKFWARFVVSDDGMNFLKKKVVYNCTFSEKNRWEDNLRQNEKWNNNRRRRIKTRTDKEQNNKDATGMNWQWKQVVYEGEKEEADQEENWYNR